MTSRGRHTVLRLPIQIKRLDGRRMILAPDGRDLVPSAEPVPKEHIVNAIGLAHRWHETLLSSRKSIAELVRDEGLNHNRIRRLLPLTHLRPEILGHALTGFLPPSLPLNDLLTAAEHLDCAKQSNALGLEERPAGQRAPA